MTTEEDGSENIELGVGRVCLQRTDISPRIKQEQRKAEKTDTADKVCERREDQDESDHSRSCGRKSSLLDCVRVVFIFS